MANQLFHSVAQILDVVNISRMTKHQIQMINPVQKSISKTEMISCGVGCNQMNTAIHDRPITLDRVEKAMPSPVTVLKEIL